MSLQARLLRSSPLMDGESVLRGLDNDAQSLIEQQQPWTQQPLTTQHQTSAVGKVARLHSRWISLNLVWKQWENILAVIQLNFKAVALHTVLQKLVLEVSFAEVVFGAFTTLNAAFVRRPVFWLSFGNRCLYIGFCMTVYEPFGAKLVEFCATLRLLCKCGHIFKTSGNWQSHSCNGIGRGGGGVGGDGGTGCWLCLWLFFCQMIGGSAEIIWRRRCLTFLYLVHISFAYLVWCVCNSVHFLHQQHFCCLVFASAMREWFFKTRSVACRENVFPERQGQVVSKIDRSYQ